MDLILWRHAEAEFGVSDMHRKLTKKGIKQASDMAAWLKPRLPIGWRLISSPADRAKQTAEALSKKMDIKSEVAPGADYLTLLAVANWPVGKETTIIVGHQPTLGQAAAFLMGNKEPYWSVRKSSILWFSYRVRIRAEQVILKAVMGPDLL